MANSIILPDHLQRQVDQKEMINAGKKFRILTVFYGKKDNPEESVGAELYLSDQTFSDDLKEELVILDIAMTNSLSAEEVVNEMADIKSELSDLSKNADIRE